MDHLDRPSSRSGGPADPSSRTLKRPDLSSSRELPRERRSANIVPAECRRVARGRRGRGSSRGHRRGGRRAEGHGRGRARELSHRRLQRRRAHPTRALIRCGRNAPRRARNGRAGPAGSDGARAGAFRANRRGRRRRRRGVALRAGHQSRRGGRRARAPGPARARRADDRRRRAGRPRARVHRHREPPLHRLVRVGPALGPALTRRGDSASSAARLVHL